MDVPNTYPHSPKHIFPPHGMHANTPPHHPKQAARSALCESLKITMPCLIEKIGKYFMLDMGISRGLALKVTLSLVGITYSKGLHFHT